VGESSGGDIRDAQYKPLREISTPTGPYVVAQRDQEFIVREKATILNL
jgi:hypothetical protein